MTVVIENGSAEFRYFPKKRLLLIKSLKTKEDLYSVLHEFGHIACSHADRDKKYIMLEDVKKEIEAWQYARRCVKKKYWNEFDTFALACIQTYNARVEALWGEWLDKEVILSMLKS